MNKDISNRKGIIKNMIIGFLAVMLVLTFFSNTILNRSLAEVAVQYPQYGNISSRLRGNGVVQANQMLSVHIEEARVIKSVEVYRNQFVEKGDIIYILEDSPSDKLSEAMDTLFNMQINYKRALLESGFDYSSYYDEISELESQLNKARAQVSSLPGKQDELKEKNKQLLQLEDTIEQLQKELIVLQEKLDELQDIDALDINSSAYDEQSAKQERDRLNLLIALSQDKIKEYTKNLMEYSNPILSAKQLVADKQDEKDEYIKEFAQGVEVSEDLMMQQSNEIQSKTNQLKLMQAEYDAEADKTLPAMIQLQYDIDQLTLEIDNLKSTYSGTVAAYFKWLPIKERIKEYDDEIVQLEINLNQLEKQYESVELLIQQEENYIKLLNFDLDEITDIYNSIIKDTQLPIIKDEITQLKQQLLDKDDQLVSLNKSVQKLENEIAEAESVQPGIDSMQKNISQKKKDLQKLIQSNELDDEINKMNLTKMQKEIQEQEALVERLSDKTHNIYVTAPVSGMINSLKYTAGEKTDAGAVAADIEIAEKGYTMKLTVTVEQSRRISVGMHAEVEYYYGYSAPQAVVSSIQIDYTNPQNSRIVELEINGDDIYPGQMIYVALGESSRNFDAVLPNSAINEDNKGTFVYIVEAKNTPIGNRYTVKRVDVQVLASDERQSAVSGIDAYGYHVVTNASKPINNADQVRLKEN